MFQDNSDAMHVQPSLPEVGIHGEDGLPVGGKLGLRGVFGAAVLQRQHLEHNEKKNKKTTWSAVVRHCIIWMCECKCELLVMVRTAVQSTGVVEPGGM